MGIKARNFDEQRFTLVSPGAQAAGTELDFAYADFDGFVKNIYGELSVSGSLGSEVVDLNKNGTTIFGAGANKIKFTSNVGTAVFTGVGLNDMTSGGNFTGTADATFTIVITTAAVTDKFKWKKGTGALSAEISITGAAQALSDGVTVTFGATTGHTLADQWTVACSAGKAASVIDPVSATDQNIAAGDRFSIDVDSVHTNVGKGLSVHVTLSRRNPNSVSNLAPSALK